MESRCIPLFPSHSLFVHQDQATAREDESIPDQHEGCVNLFAGARQPPELLECSLRIEFCRIASDPAHESHDFSLSKSPVRCMTRRPPTGTRCTWRVGNVGRRRHPERQCNAPCRGPRTVSLLRPAVSQLGSGRTTGRYKGDDSWRSPVDAAIRDRYTARDTSGRATMTQCRILPTLRPEWSTTEPSCFEDAAEHSSNHVRVFRARWTEQIAGR